MIVKLKDANIDFMSIPELKKINQNLKYKNSFIKVPKKQRQENKKINGKIKIIEKILKEIFKKI